MTVTKQYLDELDRMTAEIGKVMETFPETFSLRAYPGKVFRISRRASYVSNGAKPEIILYVEVQVQSKSESILKNSPMWEQFSKGTVEETWAEIVYPKWSPKQVCEALAAWWGDDGEGGNICDAPIYPGAHIMGDEPIRDVVRRAVGWRKP